MSTETHNEAVDAYSVPKFCASHNLSRGYLYVLWADGRGPRFFRLGRRKLISREAAAAWRRRMETETAERVEA